MLASQRHLFDIPEGICYLNAASYSPLPLATQEAARAAVARKGRPWTVTPAFQSEQYERCRRAAARLIHAEPDDVALVSSIGYGVASAAKCLKVAPGARVLVLEDDHTSPVLEWQVRAPSSGFSVEVVRRPADGDWTAAVLSAVERRDAAPLALASISSIHWSDGGLIDLARLAPALKARGAALLVDATHGVGVVDLDVRALDPDFVAFPTYKWLLGPYGRAFLYVAKRHQDGVPLEQTSHGRRAVKAEQDVYFADTSYTTDARRFDMGERDHFISMEMASIGMETMAAWGTAAIAGRLAALTGRLADALLACKGARALAIADVRLRAPNLLSVTVPEGKAAAIAASLAQEDIYIAPRLGRLRVSPHVYNTEADIDRLALALAKRL